MSLHFRKRAGFVFRFSLGVQTSTGKNGSFFFRMKSSFFSLFNSEKQSETKRVSGGIGDTIHAKNKFFSNAWKKKQWVNSCKLSTRESLSIWFDKRYGIFLKNDIISEANYEKAKNGFLSEYH